MEMKELVKKFQMEMPHLVRQMKDADHNYSSQHINPYHIESDVFTHTMMVCLLAERFKVNKLVQIAALLHDVGKPLSRKVDQDQQKVKFYGHEGLSCFVAIDFLNKLELTKAEKLHILELISYHTYMYKMVDPNSSVQTDIIEKFIGKKQLVQDLIALTKCDALGRFTATDTSVIEKLEEYVLPSLELMEERTIKNSYKGTVTVLVGPPNAGKSTWLTKNKGNALVLSRDEVILEIAGTQDYDVAYKKVDMGKVDAVFNQKVKDAVKSGRDVIFDMTSMSAKSRRRNFSTFGKEYYRKVVVFYTSYETLMRRNKERSQKLNKTIPDRVMVDMLANFMAPLYDEVDEIENIIQE